MQSGLLLVLAILLEVAGTTFLKVSAGLTRPWVVMGIVLCYLASFACLALVLERIDMSVAYAIWAGLGIVLITAVGVVFFREPMTFWRTTCITLVLIGVVGLNLSH